MLVFSCGRRAAAAADPLRRSRRSLRSPKSLRNPRSRRPGAREIPGARACETPGPGGEAPIPPGTPGPGHESRGLRPARDRRRGGQAFEVTSLEDSGAGSFREVLDKVNAFGSKPARIVFKVGGVIPVLSPLHLDVSNVTIDGSTAPAPGVTLNARDIMKYLYDEEGFLTQPIPKVRNRFKPGATRAFRGPLLAISKVENVVIRDVRFRESPSHQIHVAGRAKRSSSTTSRPRPAGEGPFS